MMHIHNSKIFFRAYDFKTKQNVRFYQKKNDEKFHIVLIYIFHIIRMISSSGSLILKLGDHCIVSTSRYCDVNMVQYFLQLTDTSDQRTDFFFQRPFPSQILLTNFPESGHSISGHFFFTKQQRCLIFLSNQRTVSKNGK